MARCTRSTFLRQPEHHPLTALIAAVNASLVAKRLHRIDRRRTPCRNESRDGSGHRENNNRHQQAQWVVRFHQIELARNHMRANHGNRNSQSQPDSDLNKCAAHHQPHYSIPVRAKRHAQPDFTRALICLICGDAVESNRREQQCKQPE